MEVGEDGGEEAEEEELDGGDQTREDDRVGRGGSLLEETFAVNGVDDVGDPGEDVADNPPGFECIDLFSGEGAADCEDDAEEDQQGSDVMSSSIGRSKHVMRDTHAKWNGTLGENDLHWPRGELRAKDEEELTDGVEEGDH